MERDQDGAGVKLQSPFFRPLSASLVESSGERRIVSLEISGGRAPEAIHVPVEAPSDVRYKAEFYVRRYDLHTVTQADHRGPTAAEYREKAPDHEPALSSPVLHLFGRREPA